MVDAAMLEDSGRFAVVAGTKAFVVVAPARRAQTKTVAVDDKERIGMLLLFIRFERWNVDKR